jgi:HSP90 family molecular chaperone
MRVSVEVQNDHLEKLAAAKRPILAIAELIWNALDADAKLVTVQLERNGLDGIDLIRVRDDGHGIAHDEALTVFKKLGGSWKRQEHRSKGDRRILHGKDGQGRYKAFALGDSVNWFTRYKADGQVWGFSVAGNRAN